MTSKYERNENKIYIYDDLPNNETSSIPTYTSEEDNGGSDNTLSDMIRS